jgi:hypothetical protein
MSTRKLWFSTVEYRPNPADAETGVIGLGFLIEFTTDKYWVVSAVLRAGIEDPELAGLDDLAKQVLQHRSEVISKEINRALPFAHEPGQALDRLASSNPWSLHISEPREIEVPAEASDVASVESIQEECAYSIYWTRWLPAMQAREVAYAEAERARLLRRTQRSDLTLTSSAGRMPTDILPPWLLPPASVIRPLERSSALQHPR